MGKNSTRSETKRTLKRAQGNIDWAIAKMMDLTELYMDTSPQYALAFVTVIDGLKISRNLIEDIEKEV